MMRRSQPQKRSHSFALTADLRLIFSVTLVQGVLAAARLSQIRWWWAAALSAAGDCDRQARCSICEQSPFSVFRKSVADSSQKPILCLLSAAERDSSHDLVDKWEYLKVRIAPIYTRPISYKTLAPATLGLHAHKAHISFFRLEQKLLEIFIIATGAAA